ncbi:MAG: prepilin-type N-terminal cleavage/methylation domain-containing protein [Desulfobacteraceae bacterium]
MLFTDDGAAARPTAQSPPSLRHPPTAYNISGLNIKTPCKHNQRTTTGFTLIELMVVMLLISIILAVAIPRFEGGLLQDPVKQFSRKLISTVRSLRSTAIQTQIQQTLIVDLNAQQLYVASPATQAETEEPVAPKKSFKLPDSLALVAVEFSSSDRITTGNAQIHFYPAGYSDHAFIRLESGNEDRYTFVVQPLLPKVKLFEEWIDL